MRTIIQMSEAEEAKALPILLRHSPGMVLPRRIYVVSEDAAKELRKAGVQFSFWTLAGMTYRDETERSRVN